MTKPLENDFSSTIFSFKPKKAPITSVARAVSKEQESVNTNASNVALNQKRLSVGQEETKGYPKIVGRTRSLSASTSSPDSILKKEDTSHHSDTEERITIPRRKSNTMTAHRSFKRNSSTGSLTDALLPIEAPKDTDKKDTNEKDLPRPTRLRFALPDTPSRASKNGPRLSAIQNSTSSNVNNNGMNMAQRASARKKKRAKSPGKSRWSLGYSTSDSSDDEGNPKKKNHVPVVGQKIELLRRPLPTQGTIKYIGDVEFAKGIWVGVELESRCKLLLVCASLFLLYSFFFL